jgi:hypothetical protein
MLDRAQLVEQARLSIVRGSGCSMPGAAPATIWPTRRTTAGRWVINRVRQNGWR